MSEQVGIIGGGALGTLLMARFAAAGLDVRAVVRSAPRRDTLAQQLPSVATAADCSVLRDARLAFLCVKAYDTGAVASALADAGLRDLAICSLQNGWGNLEILAERLPEAPLLAGATSIGAYLDALGALHESTEGSTVIAPWRPADAPWAERAVALLRQAGLGAETRPDARAVLFRKLLLNSAVNPVTALAIRPNGALLDEPALLRIAERAALEAARVGWRLNLLPRGFDPAGALRAILSETRGNRSSMMEDLARGRRTEIEEIEGAVVRLAGEAGEAVPVQRALLTLVRAAEGRT